MTRKLRRALFGLGLLVTGFMGSLPALAVQPDEILADPGMEARARMISREIRGPVCQGESIDDSNAPISRDLRIIIRERIVAGDSNDEVIDFVIARYGEFVLFNPRVSGWEWGLWLAGPVALILAAGSTWFVLRRRAEAPPAPIVADSARGSRTIITSQCRQMRRRSAVLPIRMPKRPLRPCVPITTRSMSLSQTCVPITLSAVP